MPAVALHSHRADLLDRLAVLLDAGRSHSEAAAALGLRSRNQTIGLAHRARVAGDDRFGAVAEATRREVRPKPKPPKPKPKRPPPVLIVDRGRGDLPLFSKVVQYLAFSPPTDRKSIVDVRSNECRFIEGDPKSGGLCCAGETRLGASYCPYHARLTYVARAA